jgi:hypothetical protein
MYFIVVLTNVYHRQLMLSEKQSFLMYYLIVKRSQALMAPTVPLFPTFCLQIYFQ